MVTIKGKDNYKRNIQAIRDERVKPKIDIKVSSKRRRLNNLKIIKNLNGKTITSTAKKLSVAKGELFLAAKIQQHARTGKMKDDIINIINLENITRVRSSLNIENYLPGKKSIVKLIPIQYLEQGVKVLIDGKLFIAFIDSKIPIKEEIIAQVKSVSPFSLSLNLSTASYK